MSLLRSSVFEMMAQRRLAGLRDPAAKSVRRRLDFGDSEPADQEENLHIAAQEQENQINAFKERWNFDLKRDEPMSGNYEWERVVDPNTVPSAYRRMITARVSLKPCSAASAAQSSQDDEQNIRVRLEGNGDPPPILIPDGGEEGEDDDKGIEVLEADPPISSSSGERGEDNSSCDNSQETHIAHASTAAGPDDLRPNVKKGDDTRKIIVTKSAAKQTEITGE